MTLLPVPEYATAQKRPSSGLQHTERQLLSAGETLISQTMPFGLVITRLPEPVIETAQNKPRAGDQHIRDHSLSTGVALMVQFEEIKFCNSVVVNAAFVIKPS
jgi:hypothetical protein